MVRRNPSSMVAIALTAALAATMAPISVSAFLPNHHHPLMRSPPKYFQNCEKPGLNNEKASSVLINQQRGSTKLNMAIDFLPTTETLSFIEGFNLSIDKSAAETLAGPLFGASLFPYLAFLFFLSRDENECPKGVTVGFASCLSFVFGTIPAAIAAQIFFGVSLADSDWLHGSAELLLTVTNLITVMAFRQALDAKEKSTPMPASATSWAPMTSLLIGLTVVAGGTAAVPAMIGAEVHTPWLGGFMDLPFTFDSLGANPEPDNALTIATYVPK
jgi:hypothetical protein